MVMGKADEQVYRKVQVPVGKEMKKSEAFTIAAFLVAPLVAAIVGSMLSVWSGQMSFLKVLDWLPITYLVSANVTIWLGLPTYFIFHRFNLIKWWSCLGAGAVLGVLSGVVMRYPSTLEFRQIEWNILIGASATGTFWLIWRLGR